MPLRAASIEPALEKSRKRSGNWKNPPVDPRQDPPKAHHNRFNEKKYRL
jgi:hypothetical protein